MDLLDVESIRTLFGDAISSQFSRTLFLFTAAAFVHARQVRKEIKDQMGQLIGVLREDLDAQKTVLHNLSNRVETIEVALKLKEK